MNYSITDMSAGEMQEFMERKFGARTVLEPARETKKTSTGDEILFEVVDDKLGRIQFCKSSHNENAYYVTVTGNGNIGGWVFFKVGKYGEPEFGHCQNAKSGSF